MFCQLKFQPFKVDFVEKILRQAINFSSTVVGTFELGKKYSHRRYFEKFQE